MESALLSLATTAVALVVVLALAYAALRLMRGPLLARSDKSGGEGDAMRFVRALPLGPKERVVLIDYRGERWMLGVTAGGISLLKSWHRDGSDAAGARDDFDRAMTERAATDRNLSGASPSPASTAAASPASAPHGRAS